MLGAVIMDGRGLVDPRNKPFGRVLPLEIQIKIMFWVHCFYTMDKRKKVVQEFKELPKCDITGWPKHMGKYPWWNQVVFRLQTPRHSSCHHCNRIWGHRLSVRGKKSVVVVVMLKQMTESLVLVFQIGMMTEMARPEPNLDNLMNEGIAFIIDQFKYRIPKCPIGQRPVMIGRWKAAYDTVDKVMKRLDLIHDVMKAMNFIVIDIH